MLPGRYGDGDTLYLNVTPTGTKSWIQRVVIDGRRHDIGLGPYPLTSLAHAHERAIKNRLAISDGRNPLAEKRRARIPTFRKAAEGTIEANLPRWRDGKTAKNWMQGMEKRAFPVIGDIRVDRIGREDVLRILKPVWTSHPEVARNLRQRIRTTLQWCQAHGHVERNVAGDAINGALPIMSSVRKHHRSLPYAAVPGALRDIRACGAWASEQTDADHAVMELCLSHTVGSAVERAYARSDLLEKRRVLTEQWGVHCTGSAA